MFEKLVRPNPKPKMTNYGMHDQTLMVQMIDAILSNERPLHPDLACQRQQVLCRDCERRSEAPFHFVYHKCQHCKSFNTAVVG